MNSSTLLNLIAALLPVGEEIASIFIHNPNSQHAFSVVIGTVNALEPVLASAIGSAAHVVAAPAVPAGEEGEPVIPAGVPSAH